MEQQDRVVRVFISSTFRDMFRERDILVKRIFPQLRELGEERFVTWGEVDLRVIKFRLSPQVGFVAGDSGTILRTADSGETWTKLVTATDQKIMDMDFPSDETTGYAVGPNGTILKTTTGGHIWFSQTGNLQGAMPSTNITAVFFPNGDSVGFATTAKAGTQAQAKHKLRSGAENDGPGKA